MTLRRLAGSPAIWLLAGFLLTIAIYAPGVSGPWLFDDFPNIVDNAGVKPATASLDALVNAAMASPASEFKRPLASLSFAINYLLTGSDPGPMKVTNIVLHLLNGLAAYLFLGGLFQAAGVAVLRARRYAAAVSVSWMVLPIQLTAVLYVVQRMESMANLAVLLGLWGYVHGRMRMLRHADGFILALVSLLAGTSIGVMAKETAVLLPLYAALVELLIFRGRRSATGPGLDRRIVGVFLGGLLAPLLVGLAWLTPRVLDPRLWATRDFTLATRLLSEARIVTEYIAWTLAPTPQALSFYHDDVLISSSLFSPVSTLFALIFLAVWVLCIVGFRRRAPLVALGLALYLAGHVMTATVLPLELVYEHRNYFASLGLLITLAGGIMAWQTHAPGRPYVWGAAACAAIIVWSGITLNTAQAWGSPLSLAQELASRAPRSPRAQYELGRTYIILGGYNPSSPFTAKAYAPLEAAAALPNSSVLPEQALIFLNARLGVPIKDIWWTSMDAKLSARPPSVQDESSLESLSNCLQAGNCHFPSGRLMDAFLAALSHENATPRLKAMYADFAWNSLDDRPLALRVQHEVVTGAPAEPAYRVTLARMCISTGDTACALDQLRWMKRANLGGWLDKDILAIESRMATARSS